MVFQQEEGETITDLVQVLVEPPQPNRPLHTNYEVPPRTLLNQRQRNQS
jgi:hypothetical protein